MPRGKTDETGRKPSLRRNAASVKAEFGGEGGDLDRKQRTPVLVAKGAVEGKTAVLANHDRATVAHQTVTAQHPDPSGGNE